MWHVSLRGRWPRSSRSGPGAMAATITVPDHSVTVLTRRGFRDSVQSSSLAQRVLAGGGRGVWAVRRRLVRHARTIAEGPDVLPSFHPEHRIDFSAPSRRPAGRADRPGVGVSPRQSRRVCASRPTHRESLRPADEKLGVRAHLPQRRGDVSPGDAAPKICTPPLLVAHALIQDAIGLPDRRRYNRYDIREVTTASASFA
jgi:hypothetical protein